MTEIARNRPTASETTPIAQRLRVATGTTRLANERCHFQGTIASPAVVATRIHPMNTTIWLGHMLGARAISATPTASRIASSVQ